MIKKMKQHFVHFTQSIFSSNIQGNNEKVQLNAKVSFHFNQKGRLKSIAERGNDFSRFSWTQDIGQDE